MIYTENFSSGELGTVFFMGCFHYGHDKDFIYKPRGYNSVREHDAGLIEKWNKKVGPNDTVFLLGDTLFGQDGGRRIIELFSNLNGFSIYVMPGNHHAGFKQLYNEALGCPNPPDGYGKLTLDIGNKEIHLIPNYYEIRINGQPIVLSHYPIKCWNSYAKGSWMLHSHVHGHLADSLPSGRRNKILDVGVESVGEPVSFNEVRDIMDKKPIVIEDHHTADSKNPF